MSYQAIICRIKTRIHPNADKLLIGVANNYQVIVSIETPDNALGVFFPEGGQLNSDLCNALDLYPRFDETGKRINSGFFDPKHSRVKSQNFRGEISEGYWMPLETFQKFEPVSKLVLEEGFQFDSLNGVEICRKFFNEATEKKISENKSKSPKTNEPKEKVSKKDFPEHWETEQLKHHIDKIPIGSLIFESCKIEGSSGRYGKVKSHITLPLTWAQKLKKFFHIRFKPTIEESFKYVVGSRRVILGDETKDANGGYYGSNAFRYTIGEKFKDNLKNGEIVYGEIVGWIPETGKTIMPSIDLSGIDKKLGKEFKSRCSRDKMVYSYGCAEGACDFFVYRITETSQSGDIIELSDGQMRARAKELGLKVVPLLEKFIYDGNKESLLALVEKHLVNWETMDNTHLREGVVLRIETPDGKCYALKDKTKLYRFVSGRCKDNPLEVDLEEIS